MLIRKPLFTVPPYYSDVETLKKSLSETITEKLSTLVRCIANHLGRFTDSSCYYYRVTNTNYCKVRFFGEKGENTEKTEESTVLEKTEFDFSIVIAGYTEFPTITPKASRLTMTVCDAVDSYWVLRYLEAELRLLTAENAN